MPQLRVDEARNAQDVRAFLASVAARFVETEVTAAEIEASVKNTFGIDLDMGELGEAMRLSKLMYDAVVGEVSEEKGYAELLARVENRDDLLRQPETDFPKLYFKDAQEAREALLLALATQWEPLAPGSAMQRPVAGTALPWVDQAVDPGIKGEPRSREKMKLDYGGEAAQLKDLARITLVFKCCKDLLNALKKIDSVPGWRVVQTKNKFRFPTPMVRVLLRRGAASGCAREPAAAAGALLCADGAPPISCLARCTRARRASRATATSTCASS